MLSTARAKWAKIIPFIRKHQSASGSQFMQFFVRGLLVRFQIKHVHGPSTLKLDPEDLLVVSVVRNGAIYIKSFIEHYRNKGVRHFVFLDNGSTDETASLICSYPGVVLLRSDAPYAKYENTFKRYLVERFSKNRWNLISDIDELFDYPHSDTISLDKLIKYLDYFGYTAVVCQMLDMFSEFPLCTLVDRPEDDITLKYPFYELSDIAKGSSQDSSKPRIRFHSGGVRQRLFGTNVGLTKYALVKLDGKVKTFIHWHYADNAKIADISCVLKHYPFTSGFFHKVHEAVDAGRYGYFVSDEYAAYKRGLTKDLVIAKKNSRRLSGLDELIEQEFLIVSPQYERWCDAVKKGLMSSNPAKSEDEHYRVSVL